MARGLPFCLKNLKILELSVTEVSSRPLVRYLSKELLPLEFGRESVV